MNEITKEDIEEIKNYLARTTIALETLLDHLLSSNQVPKQPQVFAQRYTKTPNTVDWANGENKKQMAMPSEPIYNSRSNKVLPSVTIPYDVPSSMITESMVYAIFKGEKGMDNPEVVRRFTAKLIEQRADEERRGCTQCESCYRRKDHAFTNSKGEACFVPKCEVIGQNAPCDNYQHSNDGNTADRYVLNGVLFEVNGDKRKAKMGTGTVTTNTVRTQPVTPKITKWGN